MRSTLSTALEASAISFRSPKVYAGSRLALCAGELCNPGHVELVRELGLVRRLEGGGGGGSAAPGFLPGGLLLLSAVGVEPGGGGGVTLQLPLPEHRTHQMSVFCCKERLC